MVRTKEENDTVNAIEIEIEDCTALCDTPMPEALLCWGLTHNALDGVVRANNVYAMPHSRWMAYPACTKSPRTTSFGVLFPISEQHTSQLL